MRGSSVQSLGNLVLLHSVRWVSVLFIGHAKLRKAMTVKEVMEKTGYSRSQLQRRLELLRPVLNGALRKGPKNALQLSEEAVQMLLRLRDLEGQGFRPVDAVARVISENGEKQEKASKNAGRNAEKQDNTNPRLGLALWILAVSCAVGALSLVAIAVALWLK